MTSSTRSEAAAFIVLKAAQAVNLDATEIINKLEEEKIREEWQLEYLDSFQYQILGVPMGMVAAIRRTLSERKAEQNSNGERYSSATGDTMDYLPTLPAVIPKKKMLRANQFSMQSLGNIGANPNPNLSPVQSTASSTGGGASLPRPPIMPTRRISEAVNSDDSSSLLSSCYQEHLLVDCIGADLGPPVLPQRLKSLETDM